MLPKRMLDLDLDADSVRPRYLTTRNHLWLQALLDAVTACEGRSRAEVERRLKRPPRLGETWFAWRAARALVLRLRGFEVSACAPPARLRRVLFLQAGAAGPTVERTRVLARAAEELGVTARKLDGDLYADVPAARVLRAGVGPDSVEQLMEAYNLALAQGLARCAESLTVTVDGNARAVLRFARLRRLLCHAERDPAGGPTRVTLSGPLSLFHHTTKYGNAMAAWLPALVCAPRWRLDAVCVIRGRRRRWRACQSDPIGATHQPPRRFDSAVERRFFRDMARLAPRWEVLREADPVQLGRHLLCPDFTLVDPSRGLRLPVEIVGYWTPEYLRQKWAVLRALPAGRPWLVCLDEALAGAAGEVPPGIPCFQYNERVDVERFLEFVERSLSSPR